MVVPEVLDVQVVPSEDERIVPEKPTATKVSIPSKAIDLRFLDVQEVLDVQVIPSWEVSSVPESPIEINNSLDVLEGELSDEDELSGDLHDEIKEAILTRRTNQFNILFIFPLWRVILIKVIE